MAKSTDINYVFFLTLWKKIITYGPFSNSREIYANIDYFFYILRRVICSILLS